MVCTQDWLTDDRVAPDAGFKRQSIFFRIIQALNPIAIGKWAVFRDQKTAGIRGKIANQSGFLPEMRGFQRILATTLSRCRMYKPLATSTPIPTHVTLSGNSLKTSHPKNTAMGSSTYPKGARATAGAFVYARM